jgi:hypothetical protein
VRAYPDEHGASKSEDLADNADLLAFFDEVGLGDADCVDPEGVSLAVSTQLEEEVKEVVAHLD